MGRDGEHAYGYGVCAGERASGVRRERLVPWPRDGKERWMARRGCKRAERGRGCGGGGGSALLRVHASPLTSLKVLAAAHPVDALPH